MNRQKSPIPSSIEALSRCITENERFVITTHVNPDGDAISSCLVFDEILGHLGKSSMIVLDDTVPDKFQFLKGANEIHLLDVYHKPPQDSVLIVLDAADLDRIGRVSKWISDDFIIVNIDHHPSNGYFGQINLVQPEESSTVEIVYFLLRQFNVPLTPELATMVYTGILCDTGRFIFPNTTRRSLEICSAMVAGGARPNDIADKVYHQLSKSTMRALASALATLEFHYDDRVSCIHLSNGVLASNAEADTEGFVDYLLAVGGTEVEFFMMETQPRCFRVSLRSKKYVDVNLVAAAFNGGGHKRAAGCIIEGDVDSVKRRILNVLEDHLCVPST